MNQPQIKNSGYLLLAGFSMEMSLINDRTTTLWRNFMTERNKIPERFGSRFFCAQTYPAGYFDRFDPSKEFTKWATMETPGNAPDTMQRLEIQDGLYAVFIHTGPAATGFKTFDFIFNEWLPSSRYEVDARPHFEIMQEDYHREDPEATEEVWIPIRERKSDSN